MPMTRLQYLLDCLAEECAEIAYHASKAQRFGLDDVNPHQIEPDNNRETIIYELNDLAAVIQMLQDEPGGFEGQFIHSPERIAAKKKKIEESIKYSRNLGMIE